MIDTTTRTTITPEWLESVGFARNRGLWVRTICGDRRIVYSATSGYVGSGSDLIPYSIVNGGVFTRERLSALLFGLTGKELKPKKSEEDDG